ncbi:MAG: transglutaminase domain-containing protein [Prevotellaceae bacterium]|nr:transglutaminase domain-containing protein [Prevotellaceae bacterium]
MKKTMMSVAFTLMVTLNVNAQLFNLFINDSYRTKTEKVFQDKLETVGKQFFQVNPSRITATESDALKFLYAYMPVADMTDYPTDFYLENVRTSLKAAEEMAWGKKVPVLLFRHFVLPIRVNNEALDRSRMVFYDELKERVKGMSMKDAILEVNHWCHERVTYQPSDARTSSPLATIKTAYGRCGEESTFTVAALRSVGIPARQVYTPRWAHTDDNHAWVEAWADGAWYFLGACEPEPVLNLGWFNAPASRAMLMHTRAFGDYDGPEEVMLRTSNFTEINLIDNYGETAKIRFRVVDSRHQPVDNARVDFKLYNYAEYYTVASKFTDAQGETFLSAGLGDMIVWASKDGWYGYGKASFGKDNEMLLVLSHQMPDRLTPSVEEPVDFDIVPPAEKARYPEVTAEQQSLNKERLAYEDSLRNAYLQTFVDEESARKFMPEAVPFLLKAKGNWREIKAFIQQNISRKDRVLALLATLSDKDLRDMPAEILQDHLSAPSDQLSPRVEDELITRPFKQEFSRVFEASVAEKMRKNPALLVDWTRKNIRLNPDKNALRIAQTPMGVWESRYTDERSRDIFFVSMARSLGIEARKDGVTRKVQYRHNGQWIDVDFNADKQTVTPTGTLMLDFTPNKLVDNPKYYSHFTLSKINNGVTSLLSFDEGQVDMGGGVSWINSFKDGATLDEGTYELVTGVRMANGSVLSSSQIFNIAAGDTTRIELKLRNHDTDVYVIGSFDSESKYIDLATRKEVSILSQTGRGYFTIGLIGVGQEPTNHSLRDIALKKDVFEQWNRPMILLFESEADAQKFNAAEFRNLPGTVVYGIDKDGSIRRQIASEMKLANNGLLPVFFIADTFNRVVHLSQGYTIGLGEQLEKTIRKL